MAILQGKQGKQRRGIIHRIIILGLVTVAALVGGETNAQLAMGGKPQTDSLRLHWRDKSPNFGAEKDTSALMRMAQAVTGGKGNNRISSDYLGYTLEKKHGYAVHHGIDFEAPVGSPIYALRSGTVVAKVQGNAVKSVVIIKDAATGLIWSYGHINHSGIEKGEKVSAGQPLGTVLDPAIAGQTWPPHVHISVMRVMPGYPVPIGWGRAYGDSEQEAIDNAKRYTVNPAQAYVM